MKRQASLRWSGKVGRGRLAVAGNRQEPFASICGDLRSNLPIFRLIRGFSDPKSEPQRPSAPKKGCRQPFQRKKCPQNGVHAFRVTSSGRFSKKYSRKGAKSAKRHAALQKLLRVLASWRVAVFGSETSRNGPRRRKRVRKGRFRAVWGRFSMKNRDFRPETGIFRKIGHFQPRMDTDRHGYAGERDRTAFTTNGTNFSNG